MCRKQTRTSATKVVWICTVAILTISLAISQPIGAAKPKGWTEIFADTNYGGPDGIVYDVTEYNRALIVAGAFTSVGGDLSGTIDANNIAAFDGSH